MRNALIAVRDTFCNMNRGRDPETICIVRMSALGDVLMFLPLVRALQTAFPAAKITWIISKPAYYLVEGLADIDFFVLEKPRTFKDYWCFRQQFKDRRFDVLLAAQASMRANLLYPWIKADRKIGYDKHRAKDLHGFFITETITPGKDHTLESFLKFAAALGVDEPDIRWDLPIQEDDQQWAIQHVPAGRYVVVNPAASKSERSWPVSRYIAVIRYLKQRGFDIVLTGGPGEYDRSLANQILSQTVCYDLVGKTKPKQLLAVIEKAACILCPDTGPSHMACAVGTPVAALHAVTNPFISGPYTSKDTAINRYDDAVKLLLGQKPETVPWGTQVHDARAMSLIEVDEVIACLDKLI